MPKKVHIPRPYIIPIRSKPTHETFGVHVDLPITWFYFLNLG